MSSEPLVTRGALTLCCSDMAAPPLFWTEADGSRHGYEPGAAAAVAEAMGLELHWIFRQWADFARALAESECDGIWCGSAITPERERRFLYTRPYAVFDESVVVRGRGCRVAPRVTCTAAASARSPAAPTWRWPRRSRAPCACPSTVSPTTCSATCCAPCRRARSTRSSTTTSRSSASSAPIPTSAWPSRSRPATAGAAPLRLGDDQLKRALDDAIAQADLPAVWRQLAAVARLPALILDGQSSPSKYSSRGLRRTISRVDADQDLVRVGELGHVRRARGC